MVDCSITSGDNKVVIHALLDCGATRFAFVHEQFFSQHNLPRYQLRVSRALDVIDGRSILSGDITELVRVTPDTGGHREELAAFVTSLGQYPLVLGIPWLAHHDPLIRWSMGQVRFDSARCLGRCLLKPLTIQGSPPTPLPPLGPPRGHIPATAPAPATATVPATATALAPAIAPATTTALAPAIAPATATAPAKPLSISAIGAASGW